MIEVEAAPGAIVDLHDGWPRVTSTERDRTPTIEGLRLALPRLADQGYRFVTISQLLQRLSRNSGKHFAGCPSPSDGRGRIPTPPAPRH